jgi:dihydrofolate reductase
MYDAPIELVVAAAENDVIGRGGQLPWHLPADLKHFKSLTVGKSILMGRKTHESIGKALPERTNIVMSRAARSAPAGCQLVRTLEEARELTASPLMVIGGAEVYRLSIPMARRIHLTLVHTRIEDGDTFFADWRGPQWREINRERHEADAKNAFAYSFITLDRRDAA